MPHKRTEIRNALVSTLISANIVGSKVYPNRVHNTIKGTLPNILVFDESETSTSRDINGRTRLRVISMRIEATIEASENYDEALDNLCLSIENAINANPKLSGTASGCVYQGTELAFEAAEKTVGRATLTYEITYLT